MFRNPVLILMAVSGIVALAALTRCPGGDQEARRSVVDPPEAPSICPHDCTWSSRCDHWRPMAKRDRRPVDKVVHRDR